VRPEGKAVALSAQYSVAEHSDYDPERHASEETHDLVRLPPSKQGEQPSASCGEKQLEQRAN
jgi:hypothetical protein